MLFGNPLRSFLLYYRAELRTKEYNFADMGRGGGNT